MYVISVVIQPKVIDISTVSGNKPPTFRDSGWFTTQKSHCCVSFYPWTQFGIKYEIHMGHFRCTKSPIIFEVWAPQWNIKDCIFDWAILATIVYVNIYDALLILKKNIYTFTLLKS